MESRYRESMEQAAQIARQAIPFATQHELPVNPVNYAVFYEYFAAINPALREEAERILEASRRLSQEAMEELHRPHIARNEERTITKIREELASILNGAIQSLKSADADSAHYRTCLSASIDKLKTKKSPGDIRGLLEEIIGETQKMSESGMRLYEQLRATEQELETVREQVKRAESEALTDPLTQLSNRLALDRSLAAHCDEAKRGGGKLSVLKIDVDHFKQFNDTHGQPVGDEVLRYVARVIRMMVRGEDVVARYGGEEFSVVLPNTALEGAMKVAGNIRERIARTPLKRKQSGESIGRVSVSIGVVEYRADESPTHLISRADAALYMAKHQGCNRVCAEFKQ